MQQRRLIDTRKQGSVPSAMFRQRRRFRMTMAAVGAVLTASALLRA